MTPNELRAFQQGLISAAVIVAKTHDQPGIAAEILIAGGIRTLTHLKECGADDFDLSALSECVSTSSTGAAPSSRNALDKERGAVHNNVDIGEK